MKGSTKGYQFESIFMEKLKKKSQSLILLFFLVVEIQFEKMLLQVMSDTQQVCSVMVEVSLDLFAQHMNNSLFRHKKYLNN